MHHLMSRATKCAKVSRRRRVWLKQRKPPTHYPEAIVRVDPFADPFFDSTTGGLGPLCLNRNSNIVSDQHQVRVRWFALTLDGIYCELQLHFDFMIHCILAPDEAFPDCLSYFRRDSNGIAERVGDSNSCGWYSTSTSSRRATGCLSKKMSISGPPLRCRYRTSFITCRWIRREPARRVLTRLGIRNGS